VWKADETISVGRKIRDLLCTEASKYTEQLRNKREMRSMESK
jgi:hypothetical protein